MRQHTFDLKHVANYATYENAQRALEKKLPEYIRSLHGVRYLIASQDNRFIPVVHLTTPEVQYLAGTIAHFFYVIL